jgi:hypothetical protein
MATFYTCIGKTESVEKHQRQWLKKTLKDIAEENPDKMLFEDGSLYVKFEDEPKKKPRKRYPKKSNAKTNSPKPNKPNASSELQNNAKS